VVVGAAAVAAVARMVAVAAASVRAAVPGLLACEHAAVAGLSVSVRVVVSVRALASVVAVASVAAVAAAAGSASGRLTTSGPMTGGTVAGGTVLAAHPGERAVSAKSHNLTAGINSWRWCTGFSAQCGDGVEQPAAMSDSRNTEILQVLRDQFREYLTERRLILFEAKPPQPIPDSHYGGPCFT
jgi:hypothetical protein